MTGILIFVGIIAVVACVGFRLTCLRIALNLTPLAIGLGYTVQLILSGHVTWSVIVALVSLYVTCLWWEILDEMVWMKVGLCGDFKPAIAARLRRSLRRPHS